MAVLILGGLGGVQACGGGGATANTLSHGRNATVLQDQLDSWLPRSPDYRLVEAVPDDMRMACATRLMATEPVNAATPRTVKKAYFWEQCVAYYDGDIGGISSTAVAVSYHPDASASPCSWTFEEARDDDYVGSIKRLFPKSTWDLIFAARQPWEDAIVAEAKGRYREGKADVTSFACVDGHAAQVHAGADPVKAP